MTTYFGPGESRLMKLHLVPVAKPAPPRPRRPEVLTSLVISAGAMSSNALRRALYPPAFDAYTSRVWRSGVPNQRVSKLVGASPCDPRSSGIFCSFPPHLLGRVREGGLRCCR